MARAEATHEVQQVLGQPCPQGQRGHVFHHPVQKTHAPRLQGQQRFAEFGVFAQQLTKHGLGHAEHRGAAMGVRVVGVGAAVQHLGLAYPDAGFHVGQGHQLARRGRAPKADGPAGAGKPMLREFALLHNEVAMCVARDGAQAKDVVPQRRAQGREPASPVNGCAFFGCQKGLLWVAIGAVVHGR